MLIIDKESSMAGGAILGRRRESARGAEHSGAPPFPPGIRREVRLLREEKGRTHADEDTHTNLHMYTARFIHTQAQHDAQAQNCTCTSTE